MGDYVTWVNLDQEYIAKMFRWFDCDPHCISALEFVKQILYQSDLVLKNGIQQIPEDLKRDKKRKKREEEGAEDTDGRALEYADVLEQKKDFTRAIYSPDNLYKFICKAIKYKLLLGFCCYIVTIKEGEFTVEFDVYDPFYAMEMGDTNVFKVVPAAPSKGVYKPDVVVMISTTDKNGDRIAYSHSNHSSEEWVNTKSNRLGNNRHLYVHIWNDEVPMVRYRGTGIAKPLSPMVVIFDQLDQLNTLEAEQYATLNENRKADIVLTSRPRPPLSDNEIGVRTMRLVTNTPSSVARDESSDISSFNRRQVEQQRQQDLLQQQQSVYYNPTDQSDKVVTWDGKLERHHIIPDGMDVAGHRFATDATKSLEISIQQKEKLYFRLDELITGYSDARGHGTTSNTYNKISSELNFLKYSSVISGHQKNALEILNVAHRHVVYQLNQMEIDEKSPVNFQVMDDLDPQTKVRKKLLRSGLGPVFTSEFVFESDSHTKKLLDVPEMLTMVEKGILDKDEMRSKVV